VFGGLDRVSMFEMNKHLGQHLSWSWLSLTWPPWSASRAP